MEYRIQQRSWSLTGCSCKQEPKRMRRKSSHVWKLGRGRESSTDPARQRQSLLLLHTRIKPQRRLPVFDYSSSKMAKHREEEERRVLSSWKLSREGELRRSPDRAAATASLPYSHRKPDQQQRPNSDHRVFSSSTSISDSNKNENVKADCRCG